ncbi:hypothetical protein DXT90_16270 [Agrobacterium tumefaciens]|uniref:hypothetical protein n=1 Tax=Agrobacterium sp. 22094 TaxID=3453872 RepID=UPI0011A522BD|nr:hypothetical protein [Agrobacterium tumefaciens]
MLTINRKGFKVMPAITDNELAGIGLVAHNWSQLEGLIDVLIVQAGGQPFESGKGSRASFVERARYLKSEIATQIRLEWATPLTNILNDALSVKTHRDQIVHGVWGKENDAMGVSVLQRGKAASSRRIEYSKLRDIALQIDHITAHLMEIIISSCEKHRCEVFTVSEAWRVIRIK